MSNSTRWAGAVLPAPNTHVACDQLLAAIERWKRNVYSDLPGDPPSWEEWLGLTSALIQWRDCHASHIEVLPLVQMREMILTRFRDGESHRDLWVLSARERQLFGEADATLNRLKDLVEAKKPARRGRKPVHDPKQDQQLADAWKSGRYKTNKELAREFHMAHADVHKARERHRKREAKAERESRQPT